MYIYILIYIESVVLLLYMYVKISLSLWEGLTLSIKLMHCIRPGEEVSVKGGVYNSHYFF